VGLRKSASEKVGDPTRFKRLYEESKVLKKKKEGLPSYRQMKEEEEFKKCTFKPQIRTQKEQRPLDKFIEDQREYLSKVNNKKKQTEEAYYAGQLDIYNKKYGRSASATKGLQVSNKLYSTI